MLAMRCVRLECMHGRDHCSCCHPAGHANRKDCAAVILYAAEHATHMALDAIQILGGNG